MKNCLPPFLLLAVNMLMALQGHAFSPRDKVTLRHLDYKTTRQYAQHSRSGDNDENQITHYPAIVEIYGDKDPQQIIADLNAVEFYHRGNLYLLCIPVENIERLPRDSRVDGFQLPAVTSLCLDVARSVAGVDASHTQLGTLRKIGSEESSNVVTGICDVGFDPRHAAFANSLKQWVVYDEYQGKRTVLDGYRTIVNDGPPTDRPAASHATHVGNILAGYQASTPYYGVAPASDFVATTSRLTHVGICSGIEDVIAYAKQQGRRAVVNISAGSYLGPHDGTDLVGRYLSALADDAVICFSAGNFGNALICQSLELDDYTDPVGSTWCDTSWTGFEVSGGTDLWSRDNKPFEFRLILWDTNAKEYKLVTEWMGGAGAEGDFVLDLGNTPWFDTGALWASWGVSNTSGRFNVAFEYDYSSSAQQKGGPWANYVVAYEIRRVQPGTHVDVYADGVYSFLHGKGFSVPTSLQANADGSISNLASTPGVVSVGAWCSRADYPDIETGTRTSSNGSGRIAPWSSYGKSGDGRALPHIAAPGSILVSAMSSPFIDFDGKKEDPQYIAATFDNNSYFGESGTSMASPMVAGIFALWLEADATLTTENLIDIAAVTANRRFDDINDPRWGAGAIDAYAGLKQVLKNAGAEPVFGAESQAPLCRISNGAIHIEWPGVERFDVEVFDISGRLIDAAHLNRGSYIVRVSSSEQSQSHSFKLHF